MAPEAASPDTATAFRTLPDRQIEQACRFIDSFGDGVPTLRQIAGHVGLSPLGSRSALPGRSESRPSSMPTSAGANG